MDINKNVLKQYSSVKKEIADLERMIADSNRKIKKYEKQVVSDTVTGTRADGTTGPIKITGIAQQYIDRENELNEKRVQRMERCKKRLEKLTEEIEKYIETIADSEIRRIARWRYLEELEWNQVAARMGKGYSGTSCRKKMERFFEKNEIVRS